MRGRWSTGRVPGKRVRQYFSEELPTGGTSSFARAARARPQAAKFRLCPIDDSQGNIPKIPGAVGTQTDLLRSVLAESSMLSGGRGSASHRLLQSLAPHTHSLFFFFFFLFFFFVFVFF